MRKTILALCIGLMIGLSANAFAAVGDVVQATFSKFTFVVDGEQKELAADPLTYQGTTYLPVRVVANLLGKDVVYKSDSRTIELNTPVVEEGGKVQTTEQPLAEPAGEDIKREIDRLNRSIEGLKRDKVGWENVLPIARRDGNVEEIESIINQINIELADLEAKKAELEAKQ